MREKKPLKETKLGVFLKEKAPVLLNAVGDLLPDAGLIGIVKRAISRDPSIPDADKLEAMKLIQDHEREMYSLEVQDRSNARSREVEIAKTGATDHLMYVAGYTALSAFAVMVYAVIWKPEALDGNSLFHQLMGIIEGVALTVFGYYFGSSKSSADKTKFMKQ